MRLFSFLSADDVFISYSRRDENEVGERYAVNLYEELKRRRFSSFLDRLGTEPSPIQPESLNQKIRNSKMLIIVGTERACQSAFVEGEIREFLKARRIPIIPIDFNGTVPKARWYSLVEGVTMELEPLEALESGTPTEDVIARIEEAFKYTKRNDQLRKATYGTFAILMVLLLAISGASIYAAIKFNEANNERVKAENAKIDANTALESANKANEMANVATRKAESESNRATEQQIIANTKTEEANKAAKLAEEKDKLAQEKTKLANDKTEEANRATDTARQQTALAKQAEVRAKDALLLQERAEEQFNSQQLAVESLREFPDHPQNALNLAVKAVEMNSKSGETIPEAETALRWLLGQIGGEPLGQHKNKLTALDISSDGRWIATSSADGEVRLWDTSSRKIIDGNAIIPNINSEQGNNTGYEAVDYGASFVKFSPDNKWLVVLKEFRFEQEVFKNTYLLNLETENISSQSVVKLSNADEAITSVSWSGTGKWLITGHSEGTVNFRKPELLDNSPEYSFKAVHKAAVHTIIASNDGRLVATSINRDEELPKLWKLEDKPELSEIQYKLKPEPYISKTITTASFSEDGQLLITGIMRGEDGNYTHQVVFWRTDKDENIGATDIPLSVDAALLSPDEKWLVVRGIIHYRGGSSINALRLYTVKKTLNETQPETGSSQSEDNPRYEFEPAAEQPLNTLIENVQLSQDGKWLIMSGTDNIARLWHLEDPNPWEHEVKLTGHDDFVSLISTNKDWLISGSSDGTARRWNLQVIEPQQEPINTEDPFDINLSPERIAVTNNGKWLAASTRVLVNSQQVYVWDLSNLKKRAAFSAAFFEDGSAKEIQFSKNGKWLIISDNNSEISWLYAEPFNEKPVELKGRFVEMSDSSRWLLTADKETYLWDLEKPNWNDNPFSITDSVVQAKFTEQSNKMITISNISSNPMGKDVRVFDLLDSAPQQVNQFFTGGDIRTLTGRWLVSNDQSGNPAVWNLETNDKNPRFILKDSFLNYNDIYQIDEVNGLLVTYDNTPDYLDEVKNLQIYNLKSADRTLSPEIYKGSGSIRIAVSAPNLLFAGTADGTINVWDLRQPGKTSEPHYKLAGHRKPISVLQVSADNNYLISGGWDGTVRSWNIKLLAEQKSALSSVTIGKHKNTIYDIKLTPGDRRIIVQPANETLKIYTFDLKTLVERAKGISVRNSAER